MRKHLIYFVLAIITLPVLIFFVKKSQQLLSRAAAQPANISIRTKDVISSYPDSWSAFAQGGEEPPPMLASAVPIVRKLSPRYIRIDHIYDSYSIVKKSDNGFVYDFSQLDKTVDDILSTGALPFFSLSYMPPPFTSSGSVIDKPRNWNDWKDLVKATIEHYSGKGQKNLGDVYYEVWNEPELPQFGSWKLSGGKDYRLLYFYAATGASEASDVNSFYLGGPSSGSYYPKWINNFVSYVSQNNLRLDFYSWHRYTKKPDEYYKDAKNTRNNLSSFPRYASVPLIISEWGIDSENTQIHKTKTAASYTIAAVSKLHQNINLAFSFEIKDGPPPAGGKWGLITHEKNSPSLSPKPRFKAFAALSQMKGSALKFSGEGTFVSGFATKDKNSINVILSNYDLSNKNTENVPVTFSDLDSSSYNLKYTYVLDDNSGSYEIVATSGTISKTFLMLPNTILLLKLTPIAPLAAFIPGKSSVGDDQALILKNSDIPLIFSYPQFRLLPVGSISFDLKPFWEKDDNKSFFIFDAPYSTKSGSLTKLSLLKQKASGGNLLVFGVGKDTQELKVSSPIDNWQKNTWHHVSMGWDYTGLFISIDGNLPKRIDVPVDIRNGKTLNFYSIDAAIDNLEISVANQQLIKRGFNGSVTF